MTDQTVNTLEQLMERRFEDSDKAIQAALVAQEKVILKGTYNYRVHF